MLSRRELLLGAAASFAAAPAFADTWRTYRNARFGVTIEYPDRFRPGRPPDNGGGLGFTSADGASFSVWGSHNALDHDLKGLEAFVREGRAKDEQLTNEERGSNWFVLAGARGDLLFYERYLLSHGGRIVNGFAIQFPGHLPYNPIVTRMSRSFRAGRGADTEGNP
jgi:hypothetical protein